MKRPVSRLLLALLAAAVTGAAASAVAQQEDQPARRRPRPDSLQAQARRDSVRADPDSLFRVFLPPGLGSVDPGADSSRRGGITRADLAWMDHRSLAGLLQYQPGVILHDQASIGQYSAPTWNGADWRSFAFLWNGRPLADPASGTYNPSLASVDYLERLEFVSGPRAFLYGLNGAGATVNLITRNYNSNRPYTRLSYSEDPYGFTSSDGTFAQNITRRINVTAGYQYLGTDGRFRNSSHTQWNMRGKIRYGLGDRLTLVLSEYFTSTNTGLFGGIDPLRSSLASIQTNAATVVNADAYEKITRHDVDLTLTGSFTADSSMLSTLTLYSSFDLREYRDEENRSAPNGTSVRADHRSSWMGIHFTQTVPLPGNAFLLGASMEMRQVEGSPALGRRRRVASSVWAKDELLIGSTADLAVFGRLDRLSGESGPGFGADVRLRLTPSLSLSGGASVSTRLPNFTESYWTDSTVTRSGGITAEHHRVAEAGLEWLPGAAGSPAGSRIRLSLSHRRVADPILILPGAHARVFPALLIRNGERLRITAADLSLSVHFWHLLLEGTGTYFLERSGGTVAGELPRLWLYGGIYLRDEFLDGSLDLKAGVRAWYRSAHEGMRFNPEVLAYVPGTGTELGKAGTVDLVLQAHLGDAFIHLAWENLPGITYYASPGYPGLDRLIRFGVSWEFWN